MQDAGLYRNSQPFRDFNTDLQNIGIVKLFSAYAKHFKVEYRESPKFEFR